MHALIAEQAGHRLIAESMTFVDHERYAGNSIDAEHSAPPHADVVTSHPR
jgi:hypothetical protein